MVFAKFSAAWLGTQKSLAFIFNLLLGASAPYGGVSGKQLKDKSSYNVFLMLKELIKNYEYFHDALITEYHYKSGYHIDVRKKVISEVDIYISCFHAETSNNDKLKINFKEIEYFRANDIEGMVYGALMKEEKGIITFDFFPTIVSSGEVEENPESNFIVKCKEVSYTIIEMNVRKDW